MKQNQRITKVIPFAVILLAFLLMPILGLNSRSWINLFITIVINIVVACSLRVITLSGNISFAHGAFMGVGAYTAGMLGVYLNWPIWLTIPLGAVLATVTGIITGWPFARLKTIYFCMGTMFMGQAIVLLISSWDLAGGAMALRGIPSLSSALGGLADALGGEVKSYQLVFYLILIVALICLLIMYRFEHSRIGTTLRALAQSEDVAASIGVNPTFYRLLAMGVGCFFAGLMGGFQAHYLTTLSYNSFSMNLTLWLIMYMMIGGKNTVSYTHLNQGRIIVITGSPGTGKTTTASIVAKESDMDKSVHMHTDDFFHYLSNTPKANKNGITAMYLDFMLWYLNNFL